LLIESFPLATAFSTAEKKSGSKRKIPQSRAL
jgi:hypothetical protein